MAQQSASSRRGEDRLATRVSQSPPGGLLAGGIAILVMLLALAGVLPRPMFLVGAGALVAVAYTLDKRFKANAPPAATEAAAPPTPQPPTVPGVPAAPVGTADSAALPTTASPPSPPSGPPPSLLPVGDLTAEHARLTRELTERVDDDEDVRFEKFMRLRQIDEEIARQQGTAT